jgi:hypothetical protein
MKIPYRPGHSTRFRIRSRRAPLRSRFPVRGPTVTRLHQRLPRFGLSQEGPARGGSAHPCDPTGATSVAPLSSAGPSRCCLGTQLQRFKKGSRCPGPRAGGEDILHRASSERSGGCTPRVKSAFRSGDSVPCIGLVCTRTCPTLAARHSCRFVMVCSGLMPAPHILEPKPPKAHTQTHVRQVRTPNSCPDANPRDQRSPRCQLLRSFAAVQHQP